MLNLLNKIIWVYLLSMSPLTASIFEDMDLNIHGETNYSKSATESMTTKLNISYNHPLFECANKKWIVYLGNKIIFDYDHFGNNIKTNTFTTIGIDF